MLEWHTPQVCKPATMYKHTCVMNTVLSFPNFPSVRAESLLRVPEVNYREQLSLISIQYFTLGLTQQPHHHWLAE